MSNWQNLTLGDIGKAFVRYRPFVALVAAVILAVTFGAGSGDDGPESNLATGPGNDTPGTDVAATDATGTDGGTLGGDAGGAAGGGGSSGGGAAAQSGAGASTGGGAAGGGGGGGGAQTPASGPIAVSGEPGPECDRATGRIAMPTKYAPPCKPRWSGDNGGATAPQGVTAKEIVVVYYRIRVNPGTQAALERAGAADPPATVQATARAYFDLYSKHFETYGRKVRFEWMEGSGEEKDDELGKRDAVTIATEKKAFAVINAANNAMVNELVARKVLCVCTTSLPNEFYEARNPYAGYTALMSSTQGYFHRAEYVGKRLARRAPDFADDTIKNDPTYPKERSFGFLYFETPDKAYESGALFFREQLKTKYNVELKVFAPFTGAIGPGSDPAKTQAEAGPLITRLKQNKVTSVIYSGDPLSPAIFTQEASSQQYFPEWIITGSALVDTTLFGRTYDKLQWRHAFGISFLTARLPQEKGEAYRLHQWHLGRGPGGNTYGVIHTPIFTLFLGIHMAGPNLNVVNWQKGLFSYPVSGAGGITTQTASWGNHGLWPFLDFTQYDDVTEIWWDESQNGPDEVGNNGVGMYRYVDGGKRFLPGQHPTTAPQVFNRGNSIHMYQDPPDVDKVQPYTHDPAHHHNY